MSAVGDPSVPGASATKAMNVPTTIIPAAAASDRTMESVSLRGKRSVGGFAALLRNAVLQLGQTFHRSSQDVPQFGQSN